MLLKIVERRAKPWKGGDIFKRKCTMEEISVY